MGLLPVPQGGIEQVKTESREEADEEVIVEHNRIVFSHSNSSSEDGSDDESHSHVESSMGTRTRTDTEGSNVYPTSSEEIETEDEVEEEDTVVDEVEGIEGEISEEIVSESVSEGAMKAEAPAYDDDDVSVASNNYESNDPWDIKFKELREYRIIHGTAASEYYWW